MFIRNFSERSIFLYSLILKKLNFYKCARHEIIKWRPDFRLKGSVGRETLPISHLQSMNLKRDFNTLIMFLVRNKLRDARAVGLYFSLLHPLPCGRQRDLRSLGREPPSINQGWVKRGGGVKKREILKNYGFYTNQYKKLFSCQNMCIGRYFRSRAQLFSLPALFNFYKINELIHNMHT